MGYRLNVATWAEPWQRWLALRQGWLLPGAALAVTTLIYIPTLNDYFFADDFPDLADIATKGVGQYLRDAFLVESSSFYWRFLTRVLLLVEYRLFGLNPAPYHAVNLALHLAIVLLVYYWAQDLTGKKAPAFLAALFFGVAPTYAGSGGGDGGAVAWITAVNRLLATLFFLVSLFLLQRYLKGGRADHSYPTHPGQVSHAVGWPSRRLAAASLGAFLLAILSDEAVAAFMPILALYAWLFYYWPRRDVRGFLLLMAPFAIFALLALSSLYYVQSGRPYLETTDYKLGWHVARNFWIYLGRFAFPFRAGSPWWDSWWLIHRVGGVLLGVLGLYFLVRGPRQARFLVLWFPVALLPFLPWVPWTPSRYTYVAAIPFFLGLALLAWWAYERASRLSLRWATLGGAALVAVALVIASALTVRSNNGFAVRALGYQVLVRELQQGLSSVPTQSRVYIIGGPWTHKYDNRVWLPTIAETLYGRKVFLKNLDQVDCAQLVAPQQGVMEAGWPLFAVFRYRNGDLELTTLESLGCPARATSRGP